MKYNIVFKFLAVLLCAVCLLGAVGSAAGILVLTEADLYNKTVDQVKEENFQSHGSDYAQMLALRHSSTTLGGFPEALFEQNYNPYWFYSMLYDHNGFGYVLLDAEGNIVESQNPDIAQTAGTATYTFPVSGQYMHLISAVPESEKYPQETSPAYEPTLAQSEEEDFVYDAVNADGVVIYDMTLSYSDGSTGCSSSDGLGYLYYNQDSCLTFRSFYPHILEISDSELITKISFSNSAGEVVYEAASPSGTGTISYLEDGFMVYTAFPADTGVDPELVKIDNISKAVIYQDSHENTFIIYGANVIGTAYFDLESHLVFQTDPLATHHTEGSLAAGPVNGITLYAEDGRVLYDVYDSNGVGTVDAGDDGSLVFRTSYAEYATAYASPEDMAADAAAVTEATSSPTEETIVEETTVETTAAETTAETAEETSAEMQEETTEKIASSASAVPDETEEAAEETEAAETEEVEETTVVAEASTVPPTLPATEPEETVPETAAATEPVLINGKPLEEYDIITGTYHDPHTGETMYAEYVYTPMPEYTVKLYLAPGALRYEGTYEVLEIVRYFRSDLFAVLGVSLLLFAILAVYLCCAAGRKPKAAEVHAAGLNCLPLDLYLCLAIGGIAGLCVLCVEGGDYFLRQNLQVGCAFGIAAAFLACLLFVAFCFAFVAQVKTPGGYWWRNSLLFRSLDLFIRFAKWLETFLSLKFFPWLVRAVKWLWKYTCAAVVWFCRTFEKSLTWIGQILTRIFRWCWKKFHRFLTLLPVTWQWLLVGIFMVILPFATDGSIWSIIIDLCIVLYVSHCFGTLAESTRRMSKGDLDTKVDDRLLLGCFKESAADLNALADVAVVAAQKQLKSERMKTELITNVSHDIKTPLTSIINYVDLLQKPHTDEEQEQYLEVLSRQSQRLKKLIDDLMDMSKASTGNMAVDITLLDAVESVNQALGEFGDKLDRAQLTPVFRHTEESVPMMADGRLVWRVMSNLLSNAVKYAMPGTRLYIDLMQLEGKVVISMKNISRDELNVDAEELMERFVRGDDSRNTEGSGLGLNIAKSLMELQRGQLQLLVDGDLFKVTLIFPGA